MLSTPRTLEMFSFLPWMACLCVGIALVISPSATVTSTIPAPAPSVSPPRLLGLQCLFPAGDHLVLSGNQSLATLFQWRLNLAEGTSRETSIPLSLEVGRDSRFLPSQTQVIRIADGREGRAAVLLGPGHYFWRISFENIRADAKEFWLEPAAKTNQAAPPVLGRITPGTPRQVAPVAALPPPPPPPASSVSVNPMLPPPASSVSVNPESAGQPPQGGRPR